MATELGLLILGAYLLGSVPAAYLAAKWSRGIDIRQFSDGNVGVSNLLRLSSKRIGIPVIIFDLAKGMVMVWVAQLIGIDDIAHQVAIGLAAIIGHNWPVFLRFIGGRGILTTLGVAFILPLINNLVPWEIIVFLAVAGVGLFIIHNLPLGVGAGIAVLPIASWAFGEPLPLTLGFQVMFLIMVIRRLVPPQTLVTPPVSRGQLFVNRLLFDRDIRDRDAWIKRRPAREQEKQEKD